MWEHQFSQVEETTSKISGPGHCPFNITYLASAPVDYNCTKSYCIFVESASIYGPETLIKIKWEHMSITILSMLFIICIIGILENKS